MDFKTLKLSKWKKNQFLVCPDDYSIAQPHMTSPIYNCSVKELKSEWILMIKSKTRVILWKSNDQDMEYTYIQYSKFFKFPDYITVHFISLTSGQSTLAIFSRSRYGRRDFGVNEMRIKSWLIGLSIPEVSNPMG